MDCCSRYSVAESHFDRKVADRDLRRYRRKGPEGITRLMLSELRQWPLDNRQLLDVGGGIGILSAELAANGLAGATLVEASPSYLEAARKEVEPRFASRSTQFILGDFTAIAGSLADADVVTFDRVICCYPDAEALLQAGAKRTRQLLAFTYPRNRWYVRAVIALENFFRKLSSNAFRAFVHPVRDMTAVLGNAGLVRAARRETLVWALDIYQRNRTVGTAVRG